jgi:hypothetical protein
VFINVCVNYSRNIIAEYRGINVLFSFIAISNLWSAAAGGTSGVSNFLKRVLKKYTFSAGIFAYPVGIGFNVRLLHVQKRAADVTVDNFTFRFVK